MSEQIIFDAAINRIAAGAHLSESDKSALRQELQIAALLHELKVYPKNSHTPHDFNNVQAQTFSLKFGNLEGSTVKTSESVVLKADVNSWLKENRKTISFRLRSTTDTLFDAELSGRDFGSRLLHVPELLKWVASKGLHFPPTEPPIEQYKFVQVESLLCAIERALRTSLDPEESLAIASNHPKHHNHAAVTNQNGSLARWLLPADAAHVKWKAQIAAAINNRELTLLDYPSLLPITAEAHKSKPRDPRELLVHVDKSTFRKLCPANDYENFSGFRLRDDGLHLIKKLDAAIDKGVFDDDSKEILNDHSGHALKFPCSLSQLRTFVEDAGLAGCIDEDAVDELLAKLSDENPSSASDTGQTAVAQAADAQTDISEKNQEGVSSANTTYGTPKKWTSEVIEELIAYKTAHGTKKSAEKYGVHESRIREVIRNNKPQPTANNPFGNKQLSIKTNRTKR